MKKYIPILIITSLLFSACSISDGDNLFEKKQECIKYKEEMLKQALDITSVHGISGINEIFYSPNKKTCFYTAHWSEGLILFDFLNNKFIDSYVYTNLEDRNRFEKEIQKLKWE